MMRRIAIACLTCLLLTDASSGQTRSVPKAKFFIDTPFGSLAWVLNSQTRDKAKTGGKVWDLSQDNCSELPSQQRYWFVLNHRSADNVGTVGYFSIRIIYESDQMGSADNKSGLHLFRNANWYGADGSQYTREYERKPDSNPLGVDEFVRLHQAPEQDADVALATLEDLVGKWHMQLEPEGPSSWEERSLYGQPVNAALSDRVTGVSARLVRFTATDATNSSEPVLFWLSAENAAAATIIVDVPNISSDGARSSYRVLFGGTCP